MIASTSSAADVNNTLKTADAQQDLTAASGIVDCSKHTFAQAGMHSAHLIA